MFRHAQLSLLPRLGFGACVLASNKLEQKSPVNTQSTHQSTKFLYPIKSNQRYLCQVAQWKKKGEDSWTICPIQSEPAQHHPRYLSETNSRFDHLLLGVFDGHIGPKLSKMASYSIPLQIQAFLQSAIANGKPVNYQFILAQSCKNFESLLMPFAYMSKPNTSEVAKEMVTLSYQGSCAALAILNTEKNEVHLGNLGDSRLLVINAREGTVKCESKDLNARTEEGKKLLLQEHPNETEEELIQRGYVTRIRRKKLSGA